MDPENQDRIKGLVDEHGADDLVVVLGAADLESLEVTAETSPSETRPTWVHWQEFSWDSPSFTSSKRTSRIRSTHRSTRIRLGCSR